MFRNLRTWFFAICLLLALSVTTLAQLSNEVISFSDSNFEFAVRAMISKPTGAIYVNDVKTITSVNFSYKNISNIEGLQYFSNLISLDLGANQISDITPISNLTNLTTLAIPENQISDINALSGLTALTYLNAKGNQINDISAVENLVHLTALHLYNNQIHDVTPLSSLTNLTGKLSLQSNMITNTNGLDA